MKLNDTMRIEEHYGRQIVCGGMFPGLEIAKGSRWQSSSGHIVTVTEVKEFHWKYKDKPQVSIDVYYTWMENGETKVHDKDSFSFQCRYCLILE